MIHLATFAGILIGSALARWVIRMRALIVYARACRELLSTIQWTSVDDTPSGFECRCPSCDALKQHGHKSHCALAALIGEAP